MSDNEQSRESKRMFINEQGRITEAPFLKVPIERPKYETPDWAHYIMDPPKADTISDRIKQTWQYAVLLAKLTPHLVSLIWGFLMKSSTKIAAALVGLVVAVLGHFNILIPESLVGALDVVVALLIGWLIPSPKAKDGESN